MLGVGWLIVAVLIALLLLGPDPGDGVTQLGALLLTLWLVLVVVAAVTATAVVARSWRDGRRLRSQVANGQIRLRMNGGLTLLGGSAGLPFCLDILIAVYRAASRERAPGWLWRHSIGRMRAHAPSWAATGVVTADGRVTPVVLDAKLRAVARAPLIRAILVPRQPHPPVPNAAGALRIQACRSVAHAVSTVAGLRSRMQTGANVLAVATSLVVLAALPDLRNILWPPPAPMVVAPSSKAPHELWVSLDTRRPEAFSVLLESEFWSNRRGAVARRGANAAPRAELSMRRLKQQTYSNEEEGTVWVERRRRFLTREFAEGERVGRYSLSYLFRLPHE
jgi:hypothetical protein